MDPDKKTPNKIQRINNFLSGLGGILDADIKYRGDVEDIEGIDTTNKYQYGDLWQKIASMDNITTYPCMDAGLYYQNSIDNYGVDFSGDQKVYEIFFTGTSDYFPAIWSGTDDEEIIDQMPVYIFDLSNSDRSVEKPIGNFRNYIEHILNNFLDVYKIQDEYMKDAIMYKKQIQVFSTNVINKGNYYLKINNYDDTNSNQ
jgi:hypothetical protein